MGDAQQLAGAVLIGMRRDRPRSTGVLKGRSRHASASLLGHSRLLPAAGVAAQAGRQVGGQIVEVLVAVPTGWGEWVSSSWRQRRTAFSPGSWPICPGAHDLVAQILTAAIHSLELR